MSQYMHQHRLSGPGKVLTLFRTAVRAQISLGHGLAWRALNLSLYFRGPFAPLEATTLPLGPLTGKSLESRPKERNIFLGGKEGRGISGLL